MSSSREILEFRQLLLNPVTCTQFQHFVSLKEGFLENDLLFWLEVQRYKVQIKMVLIFDKLSCSVSVDPNDKHVLQEQFSSSIRRG